MSVHPSHSRNTRSGPIICAGEALIDLIATPANTWSEIDYFLPRIGGAPANTSVAIRRLGGQSAFLGSLANDQPGVWIRERLTDEGVDLSRMMFTDHGQTRLATVTGPIDHRDFVFYGAPAADTLLTPDHVRNVTLQDASAIIIGSLLLLSEPGRSAILKLLGIADEFAIPITFDPNPRPQSWPDPEQARECLLPFVRQARILKLGAEEPEILGMTIEELRTEQPLGGVLILTDGANGCWYWYGDDRSRAVPPFSVDAVDSTGAGDAFTAAITLRSVERDGRIEFEDVRFASAVGALTTTRQGAMDALPYRSSVDALLSKANPEGQKDAIGE